MDIIGLATTLISGAIGGNATGAGWKDISLGTLGNTLSGLVGGVAGGYIMQAMGLLSSMGMSDATVGSLLGQAGTGVVSGGVLTIIIGLIKKAMS